MTYKRVLVCGDVHGNPWHMTYLFETAINSDVDCIFQLGDFGLWEHYDMGAFLDLCSDLAVQNDMPLYWIDGNHENFDILRDKYGPGGTHHNPTPEGFWMVREGVFYVPRGTRWNWSGVEIMGLGGAYSVDKASRLEEEQEILAAYRLAPEKQNSKIARLGRILAAGEHVSWWPQEQLTEGDVERALSSVEPIDVLFTHDKPLNADPGWRRGLITATIPNQYKIQRVVDTLKPKLLFHGHLHHPYERLISGADYATRVVSLNCDLDKEFYAPEVVFTEKVRERLQESWVILDLGKVKGYDPT